MSLRLLGRRLFLFYRVNVKVGTPVITLQPDFTITVTSIRSGGLFSTEVGGNFTPYLGTPLDNGVDIGISGKPCFGPTHERQQIVCLGIVGEGGLGFAVAHPCLRRDTVAVDRKIPPALLAQCECMNEREKFTDIVGTVIDRSETENLFAGSHPHATVLHA